METIYDFNTQKHHEDENVLLRVFPAEVWLMILGKMINAFNYNNICATSSYFQSLLLSDRIKILFPEVVKIYAGYLTAGLLPIFEWDQINSLLLSCRKVCRAWRQGVDATFEMLFDQSSLRGSNFNDGSHPCYSIQEFQDRLIDWIFDPDKIDKMFEKFDNSHFLTGRNPFFGRSIGFGNSNGRNLTEYCNKSLELLRKYGQHIHHCGFVLCFNSGRDEMEQLLNHLSSALKLLPNVRSLWIELENAGDIPERDRKQLAKNILRRNPIQKLDKLERLEFRGEYESNIIPQIYSDLITRNTHITKLVIEGFDLKNHSSLFKAPLNNLQELHICFPHGMKQEFTRLRNASVAWPLKKLTLYFNRYSASLTLELFQIIETKWSGTLTDLDLRLLPKPVQGLTLTLPRLKNLIITMEEYSSMDFILPLANSLTRLFVRINDDEARYNHKMENNSTLKFFLYQKNLLKSNIWKYFPKLNYVGYADETDQKLMKDYRRDHWDRFSTQMAY